MVFSNACSVKFGLWEAALLNFVYSNDNLSGWLVCIGGCRRADDVVSCDCYFSLESPHDLRVLIALNNDIKYTQLLQHPWAKTGESTLVFHRY